MVTEVGLDKIYIGKKDKRSENVNKLREIDFSNSRKPKADSMDKRPAVVDDSLNDFKKSNVDLSEKLK